MSRLLKIGFAALAFACLEAAAVKNFSVINPEVDEVLRQGPDWLYDMFAVIAIALGGLFAFFGLKTVRLQSTFYGAFIAGAGASFVLFLIPGQETAGVWLGVVIPVALIGGYLIGRVIILRKVTLFIALGAAVAGVFNQYALSYFAIVPEWLIWTIMAVALVVSAIFIWRYFHISAILATAFLGGFIVLLGTARLMRAEISLIGMWIDPEFMVGCYTLDCWLPFMVGAATFIVGSLFQICMRRREKSKKTGAKEQEDGIGEDNVMSDVDEEPMPKRSPKPTPSKRTPSKLTPAKESLGNPFTPEADADPLILELSQRLESREKKKRRARVSDEFGLA